VTQALAVLQWSVAAGLLLLGGLTLQNWRRHRDRSRRWLALAVGLLGVTGILGQVTGLTGAAATLLASVSIALFMGSAFAFVLFRHSLVPARRWTMRIFAILTAVTSVAAIVVTADDSAAGVSTPSTGVALYSVLALLLTWCLLVGMSIIQLWRASGTLPSVQRARLRSPASCWRSSPSPLSPGRARTPASSSRSRASCC
jgi:hypothetical protein